MFRIVVLACGVLGACSVPSNAQEVTMYDRYGNYSYGNANSDGSFYTAGQNGNYSYGYVSPGGSLSTANPNGTYSYGYVNPDGTGYIIGQ